MSIHPDLISARVQFISSRDHIHQVLQAILPTYLAHHLRENLEQVERGFERIAVR